MTTNRKDETMKTYDIEYCTSEEWLTVFGGYEADAESDASELSGAGHDQFDAEFAALDKLEEVRLVAPKGRRCMVHSWNGAHFTWRHGGFGSFEAIPKDVRQKLEAVLNGVDVAV